MMVLTFVEESGKPLDFHAVLFIPCFLTVNSVTPLNTNAFFINAHAHRMAHVLYHWQQAS